MVVDVRRYDVYLVEPRPDAGLGDPKDPALPGHLAGNAVKVEITP